MRSVFGSGQCIHLPVSMRYSNLTGEEAIWDSHGHQSRKIEHDAIISVIIATIFITRIYNGSDSGCKKPVQELHCCWFGVCKTAKCRLRISVGNPSQTSIACMPDYRPGCIPSMQIRPSTFDRIPLITWQIR